MWSVFGEKEQEELLDQSLEFISNSRGKIPKSPKSLAKFWRKNL